MPLQRQKVQQMLQKHQKRVTGSSKKRRTARRGLGRKDLTRFRRFARSRCYRSRSSIALGADAAILIFSRSISRLIAWFA